MQFQSMYTIRCHSNSFETKTIQLCKFSYRTFHSENFNFHQYAHGIVMIVFFLRVCQI